MAKLKYQTISKRTEDALSVKEREVVSWHDKFPGFGRSVRQHSLLVGLG